MYSGQLLFIRWKFCFALFSSDASLLLFYHYHPFSAEVSVTAIKRFLDLIESIPDIIIATLLQALVLLFFPKQVLRFLPWPAIRKMLI